MRTLTATAALTLFALLLPLGVRSQVSNDESMLLNQRTSALVNASLSADKATLQSLTTPGFTLVRMDGTTLSAGDAYDALSNLVRSAGGTAKASFTIKSLKPTTSGMTETVLVTSTATPLTAGGRAPVSRNVVHRLDWVKSNGQWVVNRDTIVSTNNYSNAAQ